MLRVRQCMIGETAWFRRLEGEYHYMGESHGAGDVVRLVFEEDGVPVALMTWAAGARRHRRDEVSSQVAASLRRIGKPILRRTGVSWSRVSPRIAAYRRVFKYINLDAPNFFGVYFAVFAEIC